MLYYVISIILFPAFLILSSIFFRYLDNYESSDTPSVDLLLSLFMGIVLSLAWPIGLLLGLLYVLLITLSNPYNRLINKILKMITKVKELLNDTKHDPV